MPTLVILAAGLGSRFKEGIKQVTPVRPSGEVLFEYSIYDALQAGFEHIVLVIREDMEEWFQKRFSHMKQIEWVIQKVDDVPSSIPFSRIKPWGTAHAVYSARKLVHTPFAVIYADDYYGKDAMKKMVHFLKNEVTSNMYGLVVYPLKSTLSKEGRVNRAICKIRNDFLVSLEEVLGIDIFGYDEQRRSYSLECYCSLGLFGFSEKIFPFLEKEFSLFLKDADLEKEFFLPSVVQHLIDGGMKVKCIPTTSTWIGMTYAEERHSLQTFFRKKVEEHEYPEKLF